MIKDIDSVKLDRTRIDIRENEFVQCNNDIYKISSIIDFTEVIGINTKTKRPTRLAIQDLKPIVPEDMKENISIYKDIAEYTDNEFQEIQDKYLAIKPLLSDNITRVEIEVHSKKIGVHYTTLYRWLKKYKSTGTLTGLLPRPSGRKKGETRLNYQTEEIMQRVINSYYLSKQKPSIQAVITKINIECKNLHIKAPGKNTVRNRIHKLSEYEVLKKQGNRSLARTMYEPTPGKYQSDYPMQVIQIDHTPVDIIIVDDETRQSIGRPWITVAIDIYSRMIVGYYLSLRAPSSTSVALCITNLVLPKDKLLLDLDVDSNWDVWGFPETIHVDNGPDFKAEALKEAGLTHGINIEFRPIGKSNYGGHIERLIGTLMSSVHIIPGTTFSNLQKRQTYDSDKHSSMTFSELETWLITFITKIYHKKEHTGIHMAPEQLWENGIFGEEAPVGLPPKPSNGMSITLDFLPIFRRTIQKNGVNIDGLNYYDHLLRSKIHMIDETSDKKKKFIFKRDPRNIKFIWFYDDTIQEYFKIPVADQSMPDITLWEYESIKTKFREDGIRKIDNFQILEAHEELYNQIDDSVSKTKKARRAKQTLKNKDKEMKNTIATPSKVIPKVAINDDIWDDDIPDFD